MLANKIVILTYFRYSVVGYPVRLRVPSLSGRKRRRSLSRWVVLEHDKHSFSHPIFPLFAAEIIFKICDSR